MPPLHSEVSWFTGVPLSEDVVVWPVWYPMSLTKTARVSAEAADAAVSRIATAMNCRLMTVETRQLLYSFQLTQPVPENVITVGLILPDLTRSVSDEHLEELGKLVETAGGSVVATVVAKRPSPDPATYIGKGKAEEIKRLAERHRDTL